jgi:prepilin-type processing-associated H-X9-DG protein
MEVVDVEMAGHGRGLVIVADDGRRRELSASLLWAECPSAQGRVRRERGLHKTPPKGLTIESLQEIGTYGVNIAFSDGHARGIYPWPYLAALAERPQLEDFLIG